MARKRYNLSKSDRLTIAKRYAYENYFTTMQLLARDFDCSVKVISKIIHRAIEDPNIYSEKECMLVRDKMYTLTAERIDSTFVPKAVENSFNNSYEKRKSIPRITARIDQLKFQLDSYDDFMSSDEEAELSKEDFQKQLEFFQSKL